MNLNGTISPTGYSSREYTESLAEFGEPFELPRAGGYLLRRPIPGQGADDPNLDATGPYPLFCCANWDNLNEDLCQLEHEIVAVSLVSDPFAPISPDSLRRCFNRRTHDDDTRYFSATSPVRIPESQSPSTRSRKSTEYGFISQSSLTDQSLQYLQK